jgi:hypothetical protein
MFENTDNCLKPGMVYAHEQNMLIFYRNMSPARNMKVSLFNLLLLTWLLIKQTYRTAIN